MASVLALSAPASAHSALLSGTTVCSDGAHVVNWSIGNDWPTPMTIVTANATMNGQTYAVVGYTSPVYSGSPTSAISNLPAGTGTVTLHVHSSWPDGVQHDRSVSVDLIHDCNGGTTTTAGPTTSTAPTTTLPATTTTPTTVPVVTTTTAPATTTTATPTTTAAPTTTTTVPVTTTTSGGTTTTAGPTTTTTTPGSTTSTSIVVGASTTISLPTTTTTVPPSTTGAPTSTEASTSTSGPPVTEQGSTIVTTTTAGVPLTEQAVSTTIPPGATSLPRTGSNSGLPVVFGAGCLAVGALLAMRKRKTWTRP